MPLLEKASRLFPKAKVLLRKEFFLLAGGALGLLVLWGGIELRNLMLLEEARQFDRWMLEVVRSAENPAELPGPYWLDEAVRDVTALGGAAVLGLITASVVVYLLIARSYRSAALVAVAAAGGLALSLLLKELIMRPRPEIVPPLMVETTPSFPSGHSISSAVIYLTLGSLLARLEPSVRMRLYLIGIAILVTLLVGLSRVLLGVHFPTDVLAGWLVGFVWAALCWYVMVGLQEQELVEAPSPTAPVPEVSGQSIE